MSSSKVSSSKGGSTITGGQSVSKSGRGVASSVASGSTGTGSKKTSSQHKRSSSSSSDNSSEDDLDAEDSLESQLVPCLTSCSRQKMRAIHMALKRMGNNDNRISSKDFHAILNEYNIKFTPRVVQIIQETFEDNQGIQFEKIFKCMEGAHQRTGRDSVDAALARNDLQTRKTTKTLQEWTEELISRVEEQVSRADVFLDFEDLRHRMDEKDGEKSGFLSKQDLLSFCNEPSFPVYGALLNAIIKHCESETEQNRIRWVQFVDMLERGQTRFTEANPEMRRALTTRPKGGIIKGPGDQQAGSQVGGAKKKATVKMSLEGGGEEASSNVDAASLQPLPTVPSSGDGASNDTPDAFDSQTVSGDSTSKSPTQVRLLIDDRTWKEAKSDLKNVRNSVMHVGHGNYSSNNQTKPPESVIVHVVSGLNVETQVQVFKAHDRAATPVIAANNEPETAVSSLPPPPPPPTTTTAAKPAITERLRLQWVYGCRANDCRNSLHVLANGDLVYFIANIAVLYNPNSHTQRFYRGHNDEIKSMNIHPSKRFIVATGQNGYDERLEYKPSKQAVVRVWRGDTLETISVLGGGMLVRSVACIVFHPEKDVIAAVDAGHPSKYVCLWDFNKGAILTSCQIRADLICDMAFNPKMTDLLITCGKDHLTWWKINVDIGTFTHFHDASYGLNNQRPKYVISLCHTDKGDLVTGDSNGNIYVWPNGSFSITNAIKSAHDGSVYFVAMVRNTLISSGRDGMIYNWQLSAKMEKVGELKLLESEGAARVVAVRERHFVIATTTNSILTATLSQGQYPLTLSKLSAISVTQGHFDAVHGLAIPRIGNFFFTAGADGILLLFDANKCRPLFKYVVPIGGIYQQQQQEMNSTDTEGGLRSVPTRYETFVAADVSPDAQTFALATKGATLMILRLIEEDFVQDFNQKLEKVAKISVVRFSSDAERLAVGTSKGEILVFGQNHGTNLEPGDTCWDQLGICYQPGTLPGSLFMAIPLAVTSIDWTIHPINECYMFRATFHNTEYAIFNAATFTPINPPDACDFDWATSTCLLTWDRAGIFEHKLTRETGVRQSDVHPTRRSCLAVSDYKTNKLSLFCHPCTKPDSPGQSYAATLEISALRFTAMGDYVITVGGKDSSILQWKLIH